MRTRIPAIMAVGLSVLLLVGCGGGDSPSDPDPDVGDVIGPAGGDVVAADGVVELEFPAGAVASEISVTVQAATDAPADAGMISGRCYDFGPDGASFAEPVSLTIRYDPESLPSGVAEAELELCKAVTGGWLPVAGSVADTTAHTVTGDLNGFSTYGPGSPSGTPDMSVVIEPTEVNLSTHDEQTFSAVPTGFDASDLEWLVLEEPFGGTVDEEGGYSAPGWFGEFHVIARSATEPDIADTATVRITAPGPCVNHDLVEYEFELRFEGAELYDAPMHLPDGIDWMTNVVWVVDTERNVIRKFDENGAYLGAVGNWTHCWLDDDENPHSEGRLGWISREQSLEEEDLGCGIGYGAASDEDGAFYRPSELALDESGRVYVADWSNSRVQVFDADGTFLFNWGTEGPDPDQFCYPNCIAVDHAYVYTVSGYPILQKWTRGTGELVWHRDIDSITETGMMLDEQGNIYLVDFPSHRLTVFDPQGEVLFTWGDVCGDLYTDDCCLQCPQDVEVDGDGNIYVAHAKGVTILSPTGDLLGIVAVTAAGIALDQAKNMYIIADTHWVEKWRPVSK